MSIASVSYQWPPERKRITSRASRWLWWGLFTIAADLLQWGFWCWKCVCLVRIMLSAWLCPLRWLRQHVYRDWDVTNNNPPYPAYPHTHTHHPHHHSPPDRIRLLFLQLLGMLSFAVLPSFTKHPKPTRPQLSTLDLHHPDSPHPPSIHLCIYDPMFPLWQEHWSLLTCFLAPFISQWHLSAPQKGWVSPEQPGSHDET